MVGGGGLRSFASIRCSGCFRRFFSDFQNRYMIHPLAYVHPDAKLGENVTVEPFAYVAGKVTVGDGTWIGSHAVVNDGAIIGRDCRIFSGAVIAGIPQDLKFRGEETTAVIGDRTMVRECATINRGTAARGETTVGSDTLIMAYAHVGHDCVVGDHCILVNNVSLAGEVELGDWAILGGHTAVHQFCRVGKHAMTSGGTMVGKDIPPYIKVAHNPASYVGINSVGLRRRGFSSEQINEIMDVCRIMFQSGFSYGKGCEMLAERMSESVFAQEMREFFAGSKRGAIKPYQSRTKDQDEE